MDCLGTPYNMSTGKKTSVTSGLSSRPKTKDPFWKSRCCQPAAGNALHRPACPAQVIEDTAPEEKTVGNLGWDLDGSCGCFWGVFLRTKRSQSQVFADLQFYLPCDVKNTHKQEKELNTVMLR